MLDCQPQFYKHLVSRSCGLVRTNFKTMTKRQEAMKWWNDMSHSEKGLYMECEFKHRHPQSLTGREIEIIFNDKCKLDSEIIEMAFSNENKNRGTQRSPFGIGS